MASEVSNEHKIPTMEDILNAIENMDMPETEKESLRESLISGAQFREGAEHILQETQNASANGGNGSQIIVLFGLIAFLFLILLFFGWRLYVSLTDRERKREMKRKQKQLKKNKKY